MDLVAGAFVVDIAGAMPIHRNGLVRSVLPGSKNRAKGQRVVREPGRPGLSPCALVRKWGPEYEPQARGWVSWTAGSKRQAQRRVSPSEGNEARREGHRESHIFVVLLKLGNLYRGDPVEGREMFVMDSWLGNPSRASNLACGSP